MDGNGNGNGYITMYPLPWIHGNVSIFMGVYGNVNLVWFCFFQEDYLGFIQKVLHRLQHGSTSDPGEGLGSIHIVHMH